MQQWLLDSLNLPAVFSGYAATVRDRHVLSTAQSLRALHREHAPIPEQFMKELGLLQTAGWADYEVVYDSTDPTRVAHLRAAIHTPQQATLLRECTSDVTWTQVSYNIAISGSINVDQMYVL